MRDLVDKTLEGQLLGQEVRRLLVSTDLSQSDRAGAGPVRLLRATGCLQAQLEPSWREER